MAQEQVFKIGIAMAGAVSAGAYTGGVMDYLLETLQRWEDAKHINRRAMASDASEDEKSMLDPSVPMHKVVIEVFGGASAGGMTSAIATLALFEGITPVHPDIIGSGHIKNKLYDSWVKLNDNEDKKGKQVTFVQMMEDCTDIKDNKVPSLLNSAPIDQIAERALNIEVNNRPGENWPSYVSENLELILTICSLRGIPVEIDFAGDKDEKTSQPAHKMYLHKGMAHFTINSDNNSDHLLKIDPEDKASTATLIECAKATGAFPIGLLPRELKVTRPYLKAQLQRLFGKDIRIRWDTIPELFDFTAIDGGTINNEPFDEVVKVLHERFEQDCQEKGVQPKDAFNNYALIMIDPFPNFEDSSVKEDYVGPSNINDAVPTIISAIRRQAMMKESELSKGFVKETTRAMIFPVRREFVTKNGEEVLERQPYAIACGALDGFGGFFKEEFREHDFFLGRKNCQSFLRKHFSLNREDIFQQEDEMEKIAFQPYKDWRPGNPMYDRFHYVKGDKVVFPIIPDLRILKATSDDPEENGTLPNPVFHKIKTKELKILKKPMRRRVNRVLMATIKNALFAEKKKVDPQVEEDKKTVRKLVNKHLGTSMFLRILKIIAMVIVVILTIALSPILFLLLIVGKLVLVNTLTNSVFRTVLYDFKRRGFLEEKKSK